MNPVSFDASNGRSSILAGLLLAILLFPALAGAQGNPVPVFDMSTVNLPVAASGTGEVLGEVLMTAIPGCGSNLDSQCVSLAAGAIELYYTTEISNGIGTGLSICETISGATVCNGPGRYLDGTFLIRSGDGGTISIGVKSGVNFAAGDTLRITGVRGDIYGAFSGQPGGEIYAFASPNPQGLAIINSGSGQVGSPLDPLTVSLGLSALIPCQPGNPVPSLIISEGYPAAFVDHGETGDIAHPGPPLNARPLFGATNNSHVRITLVGIPSEVRIQWPPIVPSAGGGSALSLVSQSPSGDSANYLYGSANQAASDATAESFSINLGPLNFFFSGSNPITGTAFAQGEMFPTNGRPGYIHFPEPGQGGVPLIQLQRCPSAVHISATMDGAPYTGPVNFQVSGPINSSETAVPKSFFDAPPGNYTVSYLSGGPPNSVFSGISPAAVQTLSVGATIQFNLNFQTRVCTYSISPASQAFPAAGGSGAVAVSTDAGCSWTAASNASFAVITAGASGSGAGTVSYTVFGNGTIADRTGTLTIAGRTFTITQQGLPFEVSPGLIQLSGVAGSGIQNSVILISTTRTSLNWSAEAAVLNGSSWLSITPPNGVATSSQPSALNVAVDFANLQPGLFQGEVRVTSGAVTRIVQVQVSVISPRARLVASPSAFHFAFGEGNSGIRSKRLRIFNGGQNVLPWTIQAGELSSAPWLSLSALVGTINPGAFANLTLTVNPAGLTAGLYQARFHLRSSGAADSPKPIVVSLLVVPSTTPPQGDLAPSGMIFVTQVGGGQVAPQTLVVDNTGGGGPLFNLSATTTSGGPWLKISLGSGGTGLGPVSIDVSVEPAGLAPAIYHGKVTAAFSGGPPQETEVLLVVAPAGSFLTARALPGAGACVATGMDLISTTIGNGVSQPVSFPRPIVAQLVDNCGSPVDGATVVANVGGAPIVLSGVGGGIYSGTWTPTAASASVAITVAASHAGLGAAQRGYTVSTSGAAGGLSLPVLGANGVVEGAGFTPLRPLAPGAIVSLFGTDFATGNNAATAIPLPTTMGGASVQIGGENAPLYFVGQNQINAQVPFTAPVGETVSVVVTASGRLAAPQSYLISQGQPGVFQSAGTGAVLDSQFRAINSSNPARIGDTIQIFANGLGLVDQPVVTGNASPSFSTVQSPVTVELGGVQVPVAYQGLAPGFVGLYQVNVAVTPEVPTGQSISLVIRQNGIVSNPNLPVSIPVSQ